MRTKFYAIITLLLLTAQAGWAEQTVVTLTQAGTLSQHISDAQKTTITDLKIIGPINGDDMLLIDDILNISYDSYGDAYYNEADAGKLSRLDLSEANIVSGGTGRCMTTDNTIGEGMFGSKELQSIILPQTLTTIKERAFFNFNKNGGGRYAASISTIDIPSTVESIGENAFTYTSLTTFTIPEGVTTLGRNLFTGCEVLRTLYINTNAVPRNWFGTAMSIGGDCPNLSKVVLGKQVEEYNADNFNIYNYDVEVAADNPYLLMENDVLYNKDKTVLYFYSEKKADKAFTVPESVVTIGSSAIGSGYLESLTVGMQAKIATGRIPIRTCPNLKEVYWDNEGLLSALYDIYWSVLYYSMPEYIDPFTGTLPKITLGKHVENFSSENCRVGFPPISVDEENPYLCIKDSALLSKDMKKLIGYSLLLTAKEYTIPQGVEEIGDWAFFDSPLASILIPKGVKKIGRIALATNAMKDIYMFEETPPATVDQIVYDLKSGADSYDKVTLHVPTRCADVYKNLDRDEYEWPKFYNIVEFDPTGISTVLATDAHETARYDMSGRKASANTNGLHLVRMSDGSVRKVINK